jgi:hypothetical protein
MNNQLWKDWTEEDWTNAIYCSTCGLPMFEVPFEEQEHSEQELKIEGGTYQCVYCTWREDEKHVKKPTKKKIIYVAGRYRDERGEFYVEANIREAAHRALNIWPWGAIALCPHMNIAHFGGAHSIKDEVWLEGDIELMKRCDAVYFIPGWESSKGAQEEFRVALAKGISVILNDADLLKYLEVK